MELKNILINQVVSELTNGGSTETLIKLVNTFNEKFIMECLDDTFKQIYEDSKPNFELKQGMVIRAKKDLRGRSTNWNSPENIDIPKGTIVKVTDGARNGDVFVTLIEGECITHRRDSDSIRKYGATYPITPSKHSSINTTLILQEGMNSRHPWDFGIAVKNSWEIVRE